MSSGRSFREELPEAVDQWQRQGLIGAGQARQILAYYGLAPEGIEEVRGRGRVASIVAILGAVLIGIGVILFVASNWQYLDRYQRLGLLLAAMLGAYWAGFRFKFQPGNYPRIGAALVFLGTMFFGANVFLVAQMYHVVANDSVLLALWSAGAFATAYVAASGASLYLAILVAVAWYGSELLDWHIERLGTASLIGLAAFMPYGLLFLVFGELQGTFQRTRQFTAPFVRLGLVTSLAATWIFSFTGVWRAIGSMSSGPGGGAPGPALSFLIASFALFAAATSGLGIWTLRRLGTNRASVLEAGGVALLLLSSLLVVFHPFTDAAHYALAFNILVLAAAVWAIVLGIWSRRESLVNIGLVFFVLLATARYFDFFFSFMDRSLAFIIGGLLLIAGGYMLERSRRRLILSMRVEEG